MTFHPSTKIGYLATAIVLIVLLGVMILLSRIPLAPGVGLAIILCIASVQAAIVALVYMHLWTGRSLARLFALGGLLWLFLLVGGTLTDYLSRGWLDVPPR